MKEVGATHLAYIYKWVSNSLNIFGQVSTDIMFSGGKDAYWINGKKNLVCPKHDMVFHICYSDQVVKTIFYNVVPSRERSICAPSFMMIGRC